jgi:hypothetical protein
MADLESGRDVSPTVAAAAQRIATELNESLLWLLENVVEVLGVARADDLLRQTQAIEAAGGRMTLAGDRRRTPGGVYLMLLKEQASADGLARILTSGPKTKSTPTPEQVSPPPLIALAWEEARVEVARLIKEPLEKASVKVTIVGRPTQVSKTKSCVVVALKGSRPPSLPKGLPPAPDGSDFSYAVFISLKHWAKVAPIMAQDKDERLLVEGYPIFDPKRGVTVILAQSVRTINLARRATSKGA